MKFSIIVVSLNSGDRLKKTVNSILSQTFDDYEIVIKDGKSTDGSLDFVKKASDLSSAGSLDNLIDNRIKLHITEDKSIYDAMNQAVKLAKGQYYIFLNCGDLFEHDSVLLEVAQNIESGKDIYYGDMRRTDTKGIISYPHSLTDFGCYRNVPCHQVCFYKADLFSHRAYDLSYPVRADYEHFLWCKYEKKASIAYMPVNVCLYEGAGFSETKQHERLAAKEHKIITRKYIGPKCILYKFIMIITLQPFRKLMATTGFYQGLKGLIYGKKN